MTSKESFDVDGLDHCSNGDTSNVLDKIYLRKGEVLSVHMDCLNQYGELITLDDIRDVHGVVSGMHDIVLCALFSMGLSISLYVVLGLYPSSCSRVVTKVHHN